MIKENRYSSFWFDDEGSRVNDILGIKEKSGTDIIKLASLRRAISNFVTIVTKKDIPVRFHSRGDSFTDGKSVVIGSSLKEKDFDPSVGLALHEGSHILLSDFSILKNLESNIPEELFLKAEKLGIIESANSSFDRDFLLLKVKMLFNWVEDRRIDWYIYQSAPGYKGYYNKMYEKYFYNQAIDKALNSVEFTDENWESYEFRIINLHNSNTRLTALKNLKKIYDVIDLRNTSRLKTSNDTLKVAITIFELIIEAIDIEKTNEVKEKKSNGNSDSDETEKSNGSGSGSGNGNGNSNEVGDLVELSESMKKRLEKAIKKQKEFLMDETKKKSVSKKDVDSLGAVESAGMKIEVVGKDIVDSFGYKNKPTECVVVENFNKKLIDSCVISSSIIGKYGVDNRQKFVNKGIILGKKLGRKLQLRNESRVTNYSRKNTGKIDKRLMSELGFGNENVFSQSFIESYSDAILWISVDASGSMYGSKWDKTLTSVVAIAKAASMTQNLDVVVDFRSSINVGDYGHRSSHERPLLLIAYDSRKDKFSKIQQLFKYISPAGITPEGLCFDAIMDKLVPTSKDRDSYFLNFSDGFPYFKNSDMYYGGEPARNQTKKMVRKIRDKGIKVLSYFIAGGGYNNFSQFSYMYGSDAKQIDVTSVTAVAKTMNDRFLKK